MSGLPFDPAQTGPVDVYQGAKAWLHEYTRILLGGAVVLTVAYLYANSRYGYTLPDVPQWVLVLVVAMFGGALVGYVPARKLVDWLWHEETITLVELEADDGDLGIIEISPDRFSRMTVLDHKGDERPSTYLHQVRLLSGGSAYEVDRYLPEQNVAVASWMAGATNRDIRRHEKAVKWIKKELSREADKSLDALVNAPEVMRSQGKVIANTLIRAVEGVEKPGEDDAGVYNQMYDVVENADVTGDLLEDRGTDDVDASIRKMSNGDDEQDEEISVQQLLEMTAEEDEADA